MNDKQVLDLSFLNVFFERVFVISLKGEQARQEHVENVLSKYNVKFDFFWGVNGREKNIEWFTQFFQYDERKAIENRWDNKPMSNTVVACAASHRMVWEMVAKEGIRTALILEDDIVVDEKNAALLNDSLLQLPTSWELCYLGYWVNLRMPFTLALKINTLFPLLNIFGVKRYNIRSIKCSFPRKYSNLLDKSGRHYGAYAYGITLQSTEKLISFQNPLFCESDSALGILCMHEKIEAYNLKYPILKPNSGLPSTIGKRNRA